MHIFQPRQLTPAIFQFGDTRPLSRLTVWRCVRKLPILSDQGVHTKIPMTYSDLIGLKYPGF